LEDLLRRASEEGFEGIALTDHFPYPCYPISSTGIDWDASRSALSRQQMHLDKLRGSSPGLTVLSGAEVEFVDDLDSLRVGLRGLELDFVLGGVHILGQWALDWSEEQFLRGRDLFGSLEGALERYYDAAAELAESGLVDSIAHLDIVKKYNVDERYFGESEWYRGLVKKCLRRIAEAKVAIEMSTAGLRRPVGRLYPSDWILLNARSLGIQVTVGTDFHRRGEKVAAGLDRAEDALRLAGYDGYLVFVGRKPREIRLD
jgi:histidinol-phosphatase (PHP family)